MPRGDRTGPMGYGPRSGRGLGICGFPAGRAAFVDRGFGRGIGRGLGISRRSWPQAAQPKDSIKSEISFLEERLNELKAFLAEGKE